VIKSNRNVFVSAHVTQGVKDALQHHAKSMSSFIYEAIKEKLERDGVDIFDEEKDLTKEPLLICEECKLAVSECKCKG
jgi:hypothetical protein